MCQAGFVRESGTCVPCSDDFFCDGSDDRQHPCPPSSLGRGATNVSQCLCNVTFEVLHSNNVSEPHSCQACSSDFFKHAVGNTACLQCSLCLPLNYAWTRIACDAAYDALCDACTICHEAAAVGLPVEQWAGVGCQQFIDTECHNCTSCDYADEWEKTPCIETRDRVCASITRERLCAVGEYAGNHSRTSDSLCLPCVMHDTLYEGQRLHYYTSAGRRYDDATSCDLGCRAFSRLRDPANPALGCVSCEVGNVLFKVFTQNDSACTFTCLPGYVLAGDDCVLAPLQASPSSFWNHSLNVTAPRRCRRPRGLPLHRRTLVARPLRRRRGPAGAELHRTRDCSARASENSLLLRRPLARLEQNTTGPRQQRGGDMLSGAAPSTQPPQPCTARVRRA